MHSYVAPACCIETWPHAWIHPGHHHEHTKHYSGTEAAPFMYMRGGRINDSSLSPVPSSAWSKACDKLHNVAYLVFHWFLLRISLENASTAFPEWVRVFFFFFLIYIQTSALKHNNLCHGALADWGVWHSYRHKLSCVWVFCLFVCLFVMRNFIPSVRVTAFE